MSEITLFVLGIREVGCQYRAINQKNDVLTVVGKVTEKKIENGENLVFLETNVTNQNGDATCPGHAVVVLPSLASTGQT